MRVIKSIAFLFVIFFASMTFAQGVESSGGDMRKEFSTVNTADVTGDGNALTPSANEWAGFTIKNGGVLTLNINPGGTADTDITFNLTAGIKIESGGTLELGEGVIVVGNITSEQGGTLTTSNDVKIQGNVSFSNGGTLHFGDNMGITGFLSCKGTTISPTNLSPPSIGGYINRGVTIEDVAQCALTNYRILHGVSVDNSAVNFSNAEIEGDVEISNSSRFTMTGAIDNSSSISIDKSNFTATDFTVSGSSMTISGASKVDISNGTLNVTSVTISQASQVKLVGLATTSTAAMTIKGASYVNFGDTADAIAPSGITISQTEFSGVVNGVAVPNRSISIGSNQWNLIGLPTSRNVKPILGAEGNPIWAIRYDYAHNGWYPDEESMYLSYYGENDERNSEVKLGQGIYAWPESNPYSVNFDGGEFSVNPNGFTLTEAVTGDPASGRWIVVSNPYSAPLDIKKFMTDNDVSIQGTGVYIDKGTSFDSYDGYGETKTIDVGQGFMVNLRSGESSVVFKPEMCGDGEHYSTISSSKSSYEPLELMELVVKWDTYTAPVYFAQTDLASEGYDRFDANKRFGNGFLSEPYLEMEGIKLCQEVVGALPYTAKMNIRSESPRTVDIVAKNIPERYRLTLIDNGVEIPMAEGDVHTVDLFSGDNTDRFKLLINSNNVSINEVREAEQINIVNRNREIRIEGGERPLTEVYNALGQKVYQTNERTFVLDALSAGAYVVRTTSGSASCSSKIIVH